MIRDTSKIAYKNEIAPTLGPKQKAVIDVIEEAKIALSNMEIANKLGWSINRVTGRVKELRDIGVLEDVGVRHCKVTKRVVHVWDLVKKREDRLRVRTTTNPIKYQFPSKTNSNGSYTVTDDGEMVRCNCPGFKYRRQCRHTKEIENQNEIKSKNRSLF